MVWFPVRKSSKVRKVTNITTKEWITCTAAKVTMDVKDI